MSLSIAEEVPMLINLIYKHYQFKNRKPMYWRGKFMQETDYFLKKILSTESVKDIASIKQ